MPLPAALERTLHHIRWELRVIVGAPVTFGVTALVMAVLIFLGVRWYHRAETDQLRRQLAEYRNKLGGASADQTKRALDALTNELTGLQAHLKPRRINAQQRQKIAGRLRPPARAQFVLTIVHEGGCWDCPQYAADFDEVFRDIPGWTVRNQVIMGLSRRPPHGLAVVVADPANPSPLEAALLQALQNAGLALDLQGAQSPLEKVPQLLLAATNPQ